MASSSTSFSGLASGIDSSALIQSLVSVAKKPMVRVVEKQDTLNAQSKKLTTLKNNLTDLQAGAEALKDLSDVLTAKGSSADESIVKITAANGADTGAYAVHVQQLAKAERTYSDGVASKSTTGLFGTGTLTLSINGEDTDITVDSSDTLTTLAAKINSSGAAAKASTFFDGTNWRLSVTGTRTGLDNAIEFTESGTTLGLDNPANEQQGAQDAIFAIDGFAMSSSTNTVTTAIENVTLELRGTSENPLDVQDTTEVTVSRDLDALKTKLNSFISAYNAVERFIDSESTYVGVQKDASSLMGDSTLRTLQSRLRSTLSTVMGSNGDYKTLASIGVEVQKDGTLLLNDTKLSTAFEADADAVASLMADSGSTQGVMSQMVDMLKDYTASSDGILTSRISSIASRVRSMDDQLASMQRRVDSYEEQLKVKYAKLEETISSLNSQGSSLSSALAGLSR